MDFHKAKWNYWKSGISASKFIRNEKSQQLGGNIREIRFAKNPRDLEEPMPGVFQKMNQQVNEEGERDSGNEKNFNVNQTKDLKTQLDNKFRDYDRIVEGRRIPNEIDKVGDIMKTREVRDNNINEDEVRKLVWQYFKDYDPWKDQDVNIISNSKTVLQSTKDDMFNDRYKALQKWIN